VFAGCCDVLISAVGSGYFDSWSFFRFCFCPWSD